MPRLDFLRHRKSKRVTLASSLTTTLAITTTTGYTKNYDSINVSGYSGMAVVCSTAANASGTPAIYLQVSADGGTTYAIHTTLDADITTTANTVYNAASNFGDTVRIQVGSIGTTTSMRFSVKAVLKT